jgi:hypothetical protein
MINTYSKYMLDYCLWMQRQQSHWTIQQNQLLNQHVIEKIKIKQLQT